jgi:hypothetical protein
MLACDELGMDPNCPNSLSNSLHQFKLAPDA